jgi:uncharacterized protein DUF6744
MRNKSTFSDLSGVEESTSQLPLVGYTVFWRLAGIRVALPDLSQPMAATGFSKYLPDPPTPRVALRRALAQWIREKELLARVNQTEVDEESEEEENSGLRRRTLIRVINRSGSEHLVFALVAEDVDFSVLGLTYGTALRILLHKKTGEMICTTDTKGQIDARRESRQVTAELKPYWKQYRDLFIARDLSEMMREIICGMNAVNLRQGGGVYFIPAGERDSLVRLRQFLADIPKHPELEPFICALGVPDAVETRRNLSKAVHAGLLDEIRSLQAELKRLGQGGERVRENTITQRLLIYQRLKAKAEMYQDLLDMQQDQVRLSISALETEARNFLISSEVGVDVASKTSRAA